MGVDQQEGESDSPKAADEALNALVLECVQRYEAEGDAALESLCAAHPEHETRLRARLRTLRDMGLLSLRSGEGDAVPPRLGDFKLLDRLGGGGMGVVFSAEQVSLGRIVALKLIRPEQLFFPGARERFRREVEAVAHLTHPNIVPIYAVGEEGGVPYLAMERIRGVSVAELLTAFRERGITRPSRQDLLDGLGGTEAPLFQSDWPAFCVSVAREIAAALHQAHTHGVIHRDVKPSNVMLSADGRALLLDFGLASREGATTLTRTGAVQGSLPYMAPEQIEGQAEQIGTPTDVYALGVTLYEMLTLRPAFPAESTEQLMRRILRGSWVPLRKLDPALSRDLEAVAATAMDLEPKRRYASVEHFRRDLSNLLERRVVDARPAGLLLRSQRLAQRHPAGAVAAALGASIVLGGPLLFGLQQSHSARRIADERDIARFQRDRAESNFERALAAVDSLLARIGEERLEGVPQMELVRQELLEDALRFYDELAAQHPYDAELRIEGARVGTAMANTLQQLGRHEEAEARCRESLSVLREVDPTSPEDVVRREYLGTTLVGLARTLVSQSRFVEARQSLEEARALFDALLETEVLAQEPGKQLVVALANLSLLLRDSGDLAEAAAASEAAIRISTSLSSEHPEERELSRLHASTLAGGAVVCKMRNDWGEAERLLRECLPIHEALARETPDDRHAQNDLVEACGNLGLLLTEQGRLLEAEPILRQGVAAAEHLVASYPHSPLYVGNLGDILINLGSLLMNGPRMEEAREALEHAAKNLEQLVQSYPDAAGYHANLGVALSNLGTLLQDNAQIEDGRRTLQRAAESLDAALELRRASPTYQRHLAIVHMNLGEGWLKQGALTTAQLELDRVRPLCDSDPRVLRYLAGLWLACAASANAGTEAGASEHACSAEECQARALAALRAAVAAGYRDAMDLRNSPELAPLRLLPDFAPLLSASGTSSTPH